jgi:hypothetical protein
MRRHARSIPAEEFASVRGLPKHWTAAFIREQALGVIDQAETYVMAAQPDLVGLLAVDMSSTPIEVNETNRAETILRKATDEPEVMPMPPEFNAIGWKPERS